MMDEDCGSDKDDNCKRSGIGESCGCDERLWRREEGRKGNINRRRWLEKGNEWKLSNDDW